MQICFFGVIFCFVIKFPKGIFDIHISLVQVEINFLLTNVVFQSIPCAHFHWKGSLHYKRSW